MQSIKEHNLKANHNCQPLRQIFTGSVCNLSKNTIWKQITTRNKCISLLIDLYAIYQRTQSESKSQLVSSISKFLFSVCNLSKNTIWKQITTFNLISNSLRPLYAIYQRTQSESKSQLELHYISIWTICMQSIKEHNLKANHNLPWLFLCRWRSVCNLSKNTPARAGWNKSESKSQLHLIETFRPDVCMQSIKEHSR